MSAFADLVASDAPLFPIEPPDRSDATEIARQLAFRQAMRLTAPSALVYANTNGTFIASKAGRAKADREGRTKGVPDLTIVWHGGVAWLEFKAGRTQPSAAQVELGNRLIRLGHRFAVVRSVNYAMTLLADWGAPVRVAL